MTDSFGERLARHGRDELRRRGHTVAEPVKERNHTPSAAAEEESTAKRNPFDVDALVDRVAQVAWGERQRSETREGRPCLDWNGLGVMGKQVEYSAIRAALTELQRMGLFALPGSSETEPWPRIEDVPDGVWVKSAKLPYPHRWPGGVHRDAPADYIEAVNKHYAPFVAVEEG